MSKSVNKQEITTASSSVINNVINKISNAVGVIYNDSNYKQKKVEYKNIRNQIVEDNNIDPNIKLMILSNLDRDIKFYKHSITIIENAINEMDDNVDVEKIDDDWLSYYFDKAEKVLNTDLQFLWGKLLSTEFNSPGSITKRLVHIVSTIDMNTARIFSELCKFTVTKPNGNPMLLMPLIEYPNIFSKYINVYQSLSELQSLGLIVFDENKILVVPTMHSIRTYNIEYIFNSSYPIKFGNVNFTNCGRALCKCIGYSPSEEMNDLIEDYYKKEIKYKIETGTNK